jgi:hypothetical protein
MRERTVPSLASRIRAISSYDRPSTSQSTTAARNSGGSVESAFSTSSSIRALVGQRVEPDALLAARLVEEEVGGDPVDPALEGPGLVRREAAEDADEDLLGEVLGVVPVAGEPEREPVDPVGVLVDDHLPGGHPRNGCGHADGLDVRPIRLHELLLPTRARLLRCRPEPHPASVHELSSPRLRGTCENGTPRM